MRRCQVGVAAPHWEQVQNQKLTTTIIIASEIQKEDPHGPLRPRSLSPLFQ